MGALFILCLIILCCSTVVDAIEPGWHPPILQYNQKYKLMMVEFPKEPIHIQEKRQQWTNKSFMTQLFIYTPSCFINLCSDIKLKWVFVRKVGLFFTSAWLKNTRNTCRFACQDRNGDSGTYDDVGLLVFILNYVAFHFILVFNFHFLTPCYRYQKSSWTSPFKTCQGYTHGHKEQKLEILNLCTCHKY